MTKLIALICKQCGGELSFKNKVEPAKCESCGTNFLLLEDKEGSFYPVSYFPLSSNNGKMQVPLKLQIAKFLKESNIEDLIVGDGDVYAPAVSVYSDTGKVVYMSGSPMPINDTKEPLALSLVEKEKVERIQYFFWKEVGREEYWRVKNVFDPLLIYVYKVDSDDKVTLGYAVEIDVWGYVYEDFANDISKKIYEKFGVLPEVFLMSSDVKDSEGLFKYDN